MLERPLHTARLIHEKTLSHAAQTKHLVFSIEDLEHFDFLPGQFVSMVVPREGKSITRAYSIASAPRKNEIDICLNRVQDGYFSNFLCDMKEGETVHLHGPHGLFVPKNPFRDSILVATGTGIAPIRGFVQWLFAERSRNEGREVYVVYGTRYALQIYYRDYFSLIAHDFPNFHYIVTLSRAPEDWNGARGYVQEQVRAIVESRADRGASMDAYICGLNLMVSATRKMLKEELGWDRKQIAYERYD